MPLPSTLPTKGFQSVSGIIRNNLDLVEETWIPFFQELLPFFESVSTQLFLVSPLIVFTSNYKGQIIEENDYEPMALAVANLIAQVQGTSQQEKSKKPEEFQKPRASLSLAKLESDMMGYMNIYGNHLLPKVLEGMQLAGNFTHESLAKRIIAENRIDEFINTCCIISSSQHKIAHRHLPIKWSDGQISAWNSVDLRNFLNEKDLSDVKLLIRDLGLTPGKVGESEKIDALVYNLLTYVDNHGLLGKLLEGTRNRFPNSTAW